MSNFKFQKNSKIQNPKRLMVVLTVFLAGLGLGALVIGQGFVAAVRRWDAGDASNRPYEPYVSYRQDKAAIIEEVQEEGFRDPLVTLVKPTAAYRPETPLQPEVRMSDPLWGNTSARIPVVIFGDMTDAATQEAWRILKEVWSNHQGTVQLVWKDFPLPTNQGAREAALAGRCAQAQGRFWEFAMEITNHKSQITNFVEPAQSLGLEKEEFEDCLSSREPIEFVNRGMEEAQALEVDAVPTVFVGRYRLAGAVTEEAVARLVAAIIDQ